MAGSINRLRIQIDRTPRNLESRARHTKNDRVFFNDTPPGMENDRVPFPSYEKR